MNEIVLEIINSIRLKHNLDTIEQLNSEMNLRNDLGLESLDLAELTVKIEHETGIDVFENGLVYTIGEVLERLSNE